MLLSAHRLLVRQVLRRSQTHHAQRSRPESLSDHAHRRRAHARWPAPALLPDRHHGLPRALYRTDAAPIGQHLCLPRYVLGHPLRPADLRRGRGQKRPVPASRLVAGRHGRPNSGQRPHPRRDDGLGRRLPGGSLLPVVRRCARRTPDDGGGPHRCLHRPLCQHHRPGPERHQTGTGLFDYQPAWLHVRCPGNGGLRGGRVPPHHPLLLQGASLHGFGFGDPWCGPWASPHWP